MCEVFLSFFASLCLIVLDRIAAKHRDDKEKKERDNKEEIKVKEEQPVVKVNHTTNEGFHYNLDIKTEVGFMHDAFIGCIHRAKKNNILT